MDTLLTRDNFRVAVLARDNGICVVCTTPAVDAHHIIERRLWSDGGYYLNNGVSLCADHHMLAEQTYLTPWELREMAGITKIMLPQSLENDAEYDKWGNSYLLNGMRCPGELFYDSSVQKVLVDQLDQFTKYVKYPRTPHMPWSPGISKEDINWTTDTHMIGVDVVITEKMDGENTTLYNDYIHTRSLDDMRYHQSRTWIKNLHGNIKHDIPSTFRICGENLYAEHSLTYDALDTYFMVFSVWNRAKCLSWQDTVDYCELLGLKTVPVLYQGPYYASLYAKLEDELDINKQEGYVVRPSGEFYLNEFRQKVAKWVRPDHISTDTHWYWKPVNANKLHRV